MFPNTLYKMLSNLNVISKIEPELLSLKVHLKHFLCLHEAEFLKFILSAKDYSHLFEIPLPLLFFEHAQAILYIFLFHPLPPSTESLKMQCLASHQNLEKPIPPLILSIPPSQCSHVIPNKT